MWRLPVRDEPEPGRFAIGGLDEAQDLAGLAGERTIAGAAVFAPEPGPAVGPVPERRRATGVARFAPGAAVAGRFTVFASGEEVASTRLGAHAVRAGRLVALGADPVGDWGRVALYWALETVQRAFVELTQSPLLTLPPLGCLRFDDLPGTAQQLLQGKAKSDSRVERRVRRLLAAHRDAGARLNVAVAASAVVDGEPVPTDRVWPRATEALAEGVREGVFEPVCHGFLHYDAEASQGRRVEPREFANLDRAEAGRRLDEALAWQRRTFGEPPRTFVAPAWGYSAGALEAAAERRLPAWHRAAAEPLLVAGNPRETLIGAGGRGGVHRVDYGSLVRMAAAGLPPTPVLHGGLLDDRLTARVHRDLPGYARLLWRRDALRLPAVPGLRWVGAGELVDRLVAHEASALEGERAILPDGAEAVLVSGAGRTTVRG